MTTLIGLLKMTAIGVLFILAFGALIQLFPEDPSEEAQ
jgi:hypothetical protein